MIKKIFNLPVQLLLSLFLLSLDANAQGLLNRRSTTTAGKGVTPAATTGTGGGEAFASAAREDEDQTSDLNFRNAELDQVFLTYGRLVERTVLKDPQTPNLTLTFQSRRGQKLTKEQQIEAIEVLLEMNGIHFENYGEKFVRAIPRKDARKEGIPLYLDFDDPEIAATPEGRVVSVNIPFKNITTEEAQKALEGFKSNNGLLQVFERTNSIVVTDTRQNIARMVQIAKMIDIATPVMEIVEVVQIKHASATEIQAALQKIVEDAMKYQEKDGKAQQTAQNNRPGSLLSRPTGSSLLRRSGSSEPAATPANVESLITSVSDADRGMIRGRVLIVPDERSNKLIIVTNKSNMDFFRKVIAALDVETTPDTQVKVYRLKYADAEEVSDMINDLIGNSGNAKSSSKANQNQNAKSGTSGNLTSSTRTTTRTPANQRSGETKAGELSKDNTTVLADKRINGLVVMTQKELVPTVESIIESMDVKLSQVLIETMIIEVGLGDEIETGIDWVKQNNNKLNRGNYMLGGGGGTGSSALGQIVGLASNATSAVAENWYGASPIGGGINYLMKSDKLNLAAVLNAAKTDSNSKYLASPVVMTVDNKEATIDATDMRYLFKGYQYSGSSYQGSAVPDYEQKEIGIKIKVKPKINPNGTVMLNLDISYEKIGTPQSITTVSQNGTAIPTSQETTTTRKMTADAILDNGQTVVLGGMTRNEVSNSESGIPILKDIPWIGKWLFGTVSQDEKRMELLIFMTPYVLNDAEAAQAEALRRKRSMSDPRPWEDYGWSASELADPVSKKETLRRLKEEAKKQDEERANRKAIEAWKKERAEKLSEEAKKELEEKRAEEVKVEQEDLNLLLEMVKENQKAEEGATK